MNNTTIMTVADVQKALHIGRDKAYTLFNQKSFPSVRIGGKHLIAEKDFEKWFESIKKIPNKTYELV